MAQMGVQWRDPHKPGSLGTKWHTGFDWQLGLFNIQAGFYQGYSSVGMGIDLYLLRLNVAFSESSKVITQDNGLRIDSL